jgi:hypothetical protein
VDFVGEILRVGLTAALPIGAFTFALVRWALRGGHFEEALDPGKLESEISAMAKAHKKSDRATRRAQHPVQRKWASFGGGFYGIVAFFTWIVIEIQDIVATITGFGGFTDFLRMLGVGLIVDMLLEAIFNFVAAVTWPVYWMGNIETSVAWLWFVAAYAGYWLGLRQAQRLHRKNTQTEN